MGLHRIYQDLYACVCVCVLHILTWTTARLHYIDNDLLYGWLYLKKEIDNNFARFGVYQHVFRR